MLGEFCVFLTLANLESCQTNSPLSAGRPSAMCTCNSRHCLPSTFNTLISVKMKPPVVLLLLWYRHVCPLQITLSVFFYILYGVISRVRVINNNYFLNYSCTILRDHTIQTTDTLEFKPFTCKYLVCCPEWKIVFACKVSWSRIQRRDPV